MKYSVLLSILLVNVVVMKAMESASSESGLAGIVLGKSLAVKEGAPRSRSASAEHLALDAATRNAAAGMAMRDAEIKSLNATVQSLAAQVASIDKSHHDSHNLHVKESELIQQIRESLFSLNTDVAACRALPEEITKLHQENALQNRCLLNAQAVIVALLNTLLPKKYRKEITSEGIGFNGSTKLLLEQIGRVHKQRQRDKHTLVQVMAEQMRSKAPEAIVDQLLSLSPEQIDELDLLGTLTTQQLTKDERKSSKPKSTSAGAYRSKLAERSKPAS